MRKPARQGSMARPIQRPARRSGAPQDTGPGASRCVKGMHVKGIGGSRKS